MNVQITFRGMEHSNSIEEYARKALSKTYKLLEKEPEPIRFEVILEAHSQHHHHKVEVRIHSKHNHFIVKHEGADLYVQIDYVVKHLFDEIKKEKKKHLDRKKQAPELVDPSSEPNEIE